MDCFLDVKRDKEQRDGDSQVDRDKNIDDARRNGEDEHHDNGNH